MARVLRWASSEDATRRSRGTGMQQQTQLVRPMFSDTCYNEMYARDGSVRARRSPSAAHR